MSRRRAAVLIAVNLLIAAHVVHWLVAGETITPIEPSEARFTLEQGTINAGFIFFSLALLSTLVLGRWVCGWGCHVLALQDLCAWLLKKAGVRPRMFRSRLLLWAPLLAGLWMFVVPTVYRLIWRAVDPQPANAFPTLSTHLTTSSFWDTFPSVWVAVPFLFVCGFATVYFLGSKGYCTYACPYGGFFAVLDRFATGRIRVTDACEGCGHCTAVCSSNVQVHVEVRDFGMVVDPGCMKCMDCVSVCPNHALYFGFGLPAVRAAPRGDTRPRNLWTLPWQDELLAGAVFLLTLVLFNGPYGVLPFLFALGCAGISAFIVVRYKDLLTHANVSVQQFRLKIGGRWSASGWAFAAVGTLTLLALAHTTFIQYHHWRGRQAYGRVDVPEELVFSGAAVPAPLTEPQRSALRDGLVHLRFCEKWGLINPPDTRLKLAWLCLVDGGFEEAERLLRTAAARARDPWFERFYLGRVLMLRRDYPAAAAEFRAVTDLRPDHEPAQHLLAESLALAERLPEAIRVWEALIERHPNSARAHHNLAGAYRESGRLVAAVAEYRTALDLAPDDADTHLQLGVTLHRLNMHDQAKRHLERAVELNPAYESIVQTQNGDK